MYCARCLMQQAAHVNVQASGLLDGGVEGFDSFQHIIDSQQAVHSSQHG